MKGEYAWQSASLADSPGDFTGNKTSARPSTQCRDILRPQSRDHCLRKEVAVVLVRPAGLPIAPE